MIDDSAKRQILKRRARFVAAAMASLGAASACSVTACSCLDVDAPYDGGGDVSAEACLSVAPDTGDAADSLVVPDAPDAIDAPDATDGAGPEVCLTPIFDGGDGGGDGPDAGTG